MRPLHVETIPVQLTVNGDPMVNGLHVPRPVEVETSLVRDQNTNKQLTEGKNVKEKQLRSLRVATMPVQLIVNGHLMVNGLHVPKPVEVVTSLVRDQKSNKHQMEGKSVKEKQPRQVNVATMPVQLTASGGPIVNGLHVPKLAEAVTSLVRDRK